MIRTLLAPTKALIIGTTLTALLAFHMAFSLAESKSISIAPSGNLSKSQTDAIVERLAGRAFRDFGDFCLALFHSSALFNRDQTLAIGDYTAGEPLTGKQREVIFRLLGIYAQLKYAGDALRSLDGLVELPTVADRRRDKQDGKAFKQSVKRLRFMAKRFGLKFENRNHLVYEISFPNASGKGESIALHTHIDVVSAEPKQWVLENGRKLSPFALNRIGDRLYGRGVQDNKNAIVAAMYAMRVIVEEDINLINNIKLVIRTDAEIQGSSMRRYLARNKPWSYNIALDGNYPVLLTDAGDDTKSASDNNEHQIFSGTQSSLLNESWRRALLIIASENLATPPRLTVVDGIDNRPDWALSLPNKTQFGLSNPGLKNTQHQGSEYKSLDQFLIDMQVVTEMVARLGQMRALK